MTQATHAKRPPCTCTVAVQPCPACRAWDDARGLRGHRARTLPTAEVRLRGLTQAYAPGATTPLHVPLGPLEVVWVTL